MKDAFRELKIHALLHLLCWSDRVKAWANTHFNAAIKQRSAKQIEGMEKGRGLK